MQLKEKRGHCPPPAREIGAALATATCALLGASAPAVAIAQDIGEWRVDTAGLYYGEQDRVRDLSVNVLARTQLFEDRLLSLTFNFDTLSGASPNGAAPSALAQRFPRPITLTRTSSGSTVLGGGDFTVPGGVLPLDDRFQDTRYAGSAEWQRPLGRLGLVSFGGSLSHEQDYDHVGVDTRVSRDFNNRNTTLSGGVGWSDDGVKPIGGSPVPFTVLSESSPTTGDGSKHVIDLLLGVTQVFNQHTLAQLNYSLSRADGYLTDPYKILSVVDPITGNLAPGPDIGIGTYLFELRPDSRDKRSLYGLLKHDFGGNVLDASYRVMTDDWGVDSQTLDMHYRWNFGSERFLEPHLRFYKQTAADFYHTVLFSGAPLPAYATADYRLGQFDAVTVGFKYGTKTRSGQFAARLELYRQTAKPSAEALVGSLRNLDLTPDLNAIIAEISYTFGK
jgi:Protein of unknown function (DUF3570)